MYFLLVCSVKCYTYHILNEIEMCYFLKIFDSDMVELIALDKQTCDPQKLGHRGNAFWSSKEPAENTE